MRIHFFAALLVLFSATGDAQSPVVPASLSITPAKVDFGSLTVNSQSQPASVTIKNQGDAPITIDEIICSGIDFPAQNNCGQQLVPGAECSVQVSFKPIISGNRTGILQITASDSVNSHFVALTGTGTQSISPVGPRS